MTAGSSDEGGRAAIMDVKGKGNDSLAFSQSLTGSESVMQNPSHDHRCFSHFSFKKAVSIFAFQLGFTDFINHSPPRSFSALIAAAGDKNNTPFDDFLRILFLILSLLPTSLARSKVLARNSRLRHFELCSHRVPCRSAPAAPSAQLPGRSP